MSEIAPRAPEISKPIPEGVTVISSTPLIPSGSMLELGELNTEIYKNSDIASLANRLADANIETSLYDIVSTLYPDSYDKPLETVQGNTFFWKDYEIIAFLQELHLVTNGVVELTVDGVNPAVKWKCTHESLKELSKEDLLAISLNPETNPSTTGYNPIIASEISEYDERTGEITLDGCLGPVIVLHYAPQVLGTWTFNEKIDNPNFDMGIAYAYPDYGAEEYYLEFTCDGVTYYGLLNANEDIDPEVARLVYVNGSWKNSSERIINLTAIPERADIELLRSIATYQGDGAPEQATTSQFLDEQGSRALATHIKTYVESRTTYLITDIIENTDSVDFTITGQTTAASTPALTNLTDTTLTWNETVDGDLPTTNLQFLSDNNNYSGLENTASVLSYVSSDGSRTPVYQSGEWQKGGLSSPYRTISVTGGADAASEELIAYSRSNAVVQPKEETSEPVDPCANGHAWDDWTVVTAATCTAEGSEEHTCSICGEKETRATAVIEHTWDEKGAVTTAPTYSASGVRTFTCQVCGATKTVEIPKLVHTIEKAVE